MNEWSIPLAALIISATAIAIKVIGRNGRVPTEYASAHINVLHQIAQAIAGVAEGLRHLPTKDDLGREMKETRHDVRNSVEGSFRVVENQVKEARVDIGAAYEMVRQEVRALNDTLQRKAS